MNHKVIALGNDPDYASVCFYLVDEKGARVARTFDSADVAAAAAVEMVRAEPLKSFVISSWLGSVSALDGTILEHRKDLRKAMPKVTVQRYREGQGGKYSGWVEPEDKSWILFILEDGKTEFFPNRDPQTGAVIAA